MTNDIDVWRSSHLMIQQHGDDAVLQAAMRADVLLEKGDMVGQTVWLRIVKAIRELQCREVPKGAARH